MIPARVGWVIALLAGGCLALAFPPFGMWPLAILGVAGLTASCLGQRLRTGTLLGLVAGVAQFAVLIRWLAVVGLDAWLLLTVYSAMWIALVGLATTAVTRLPGWIVWVPGLWVAQEAVRDRIPLGGWPWGRLAFSQSDAPWLPLAWWGGTALLTFVVALCGALLVWVGLHLRSRPLPAVIALAAVAVLPTLAPLTAVSATPVDVATVAVIQGDVPATGLGFATEGQRREVLDNHVRQTLELAAAVEQGTSPQPDIVIWPENSSDIDPYTARDAAAAISAAARAIDAPILVGAVVTNPADANQVLNVSIVWDPVSGPGARYVKQHPVPFGEYVPFRDLLTRVIGRFELVPRDFAPGDQPGVLPMAGVDVGAVICFEVAYDEVVRGTVLAGAQMLAVQTNNATYTDGGQSEQQVAMARIRAVEFGRATVVAATNGISAQFLPDGHVLGSLPERSSGSLVADLPMVVDQSVAATIGSWPELAAVLVALVVLVLGWRRPAATPDASGPTPGQHNDIHD